VVPQRVLEAISRAEKLGFAQPCDDGVGRLLAVLAAGMPAGGRILEIGTGAGVGTAWLVEGIGSNASVTLFTIEVDDQLSAQVADADWPIGVQFEVGDAIELLPTLGQFDLVFADAAAGTWYGLDLTIEATAPGGLIVVDDMTPSRWVDAEHEARTGQARATLLSDPRLEAVEISWSTGVILACRRAT
jgi:demethylmenaquinone methyltransferase/2-methoxy-6-polyprenyl-1,4-benzoquinol methylase